MASEVSQGGSQPPSAKPTPGGSPWQMYKPGQGQYVRWGTAAGLGLLTLGFGNFLFEELGIFGNQAVQVLVPVAAMVLCAYGTFFLLGQHRKMVDFCIATEGEMKKVNWSTRREVMGATKVVIFSVIALSFLLFVADFIFILLFSSAGVVRVDVLGKMFGGDG